MSVRMARTQIWHMNETVLTTVASTEVSTNSMLSTSSISVIAVIQDHELDVTKDCFYRVIVRTTFGQANPMEVQFMHDLASQSRLAGMSTILIQDNPNGNVRIPFTEVI